VNARLEELVLAIGLPATLRLVDAFGGVRVYFPHPGAVRVDSELARAIGADAVQRLAALWPSTRVMLPQAAAYLRRERNRAIHREKDALSIRALALKYELTERAVYGIIINPPPDEADVARGDSQLQLF
jgi:Mor family transcriptional regulator